MVGTPIERIPFTVLVFRWFAIVFYLFWEFVFGGIVQGQIVDAFSELRDEANAKEDDFNSNCLICSIASTTLERIGNGFVDHRDVSAALFAFICVSLVCFLIWGSTKQLCVDCRGFTPHGTICYTFIPSTALLTTIFLECKPMSGGN